MSADLEVGSSILKVEATDADKVLPRQNCIHEAMVDADKKMLRHAVAGANVAVFVC